MSDWNDYSYSLKREVIPLYRWCLAFVLMLVVGRTCTDFLFVSASEMRPTTTLKNYADQAVSESIFVSMRRSRVTLYLEGTPAADRQLISSFLSPFQWITNSDAALTSLEAADMVILYAPRLEQFLEPTSGIHKLVAEVINNNRDQISRGGSCTKIVRTSPSSPQKAFVFLTESDDFERRKSCLYVQMRSLFGIRESASLSRFADMFTFDIMIVRCAARMNEGDPTSNHSRDQLIAALGERRCNGVW